MAAPAITRRSDGDCTLLDIIGDVDAAALPSIRVALASVARRPSRVIVDLTHVHALDPGLFGTLLAAERQIRHHGGSLHLVVFGERLRRMLALLGLDRVFDIHQSIAAARGDLRPAAVPTQTTPVEAVRS